MQVYTRDQVSGDTVNLTATSSSHFEEDQLVPMSEDGPEEAFSDLIFAAVENVNDAQNEASELETMMVVSPDEVNIHEVMIASEKARLSVTMMKTVVEKALSAYQEILNIR